jgi:hypothetical protein
MTVRISTWEIQKIDTCENDEKAAEKWQSINSIGRVEALV